jgi:hydrogenase maturation protease
LTPAQKTEPENVLVIGFGNPGRLDDGLGPALSERIALLGIPGVTCDADYQLMIEDAADIARNDIVVFADASVDAAAPFSWSQLKAKADYSFSTHSVSPEAVLQLAATSFSGRARAYLLAIRGYEFNSFGEKISEKAQANLDAAASFLHNVLLSGKFAQALSRPAD